MAARFPRIAREFGGMQDGDSRHDGPPRSIRGLVSPTGCSLP
jgi:hypothetical protein